MIHAIEGLRAHIRATAELLHKRPDNDDLKRELYAMVSAVNVMEIYTYGRHVTKYNDIIEGESK
ncbi:hypothetical protein JOC94_004352 [Bacillus thermophilus]|uniref:Uncharacterized protein n=1 Tax=Siminovitchia thermophila TaxID=1245522 RepID=A0ABS2RCE2_9BACI|nr:hypothetical protein [Siminovitchia thermophila]MBM7717325.1 hypothetical protein [Siminovitchia thermophila]ONK24367.1 hypothetical protein BLX87_05490 [Bacillus sp. VT-16-64]